MEHHRNQTVNFRSHAFPLSGAAVPFLMKTRYQYLNVGDLFEYVAAKLWELTSVRTNPNDFSLVNVTSPFAGYSHGACPPPPLIARPKGLALILTFATTFRQSYSESIALRSQDVRPHSIHSTQWGLNMKLDFVSISVSTVDAHELGLVNLQSNQVQYLYNMLGGLTKSLLRHQTKYDLGYSSYEDMHSTINLRAAYNKLGRMPIPMLFQSIPYQLWPFNLYMWQHAPNALSQRCITPQVALYYFMFLRETVSLANNVVGDIKAKRFGFSPSRDGILGHISDSLINFIQMIKTPGDTQLSVNEFLAPALLQSLMVSGKAELYTGADYARRFSEDSLKFAQSLNVASLKGELSSLFMPPNAVALKLLSEDQRYANTLLSAITLPE